MVPAMRRHAPAFGQASGSVRSRAYIIAWEPISASADFLSADLPLIPRVTAAESVQDVFDIYTIIFLALAVFIFLRLRSVLGQRTGRERPPYDPYSARDAVRGATNDNVVTLPGRARRGRAEARRAGRAGRTLEGHRRAGLGACRRPRCHRARGQDLRCQAFRHRRARRLRDDRAGLCAGDRRTLKNLLSREVYEGFEAAIRERESKGETVETRFVSIDKSDITGAELRGTHGADHGALRLAAISVTRDQAGNVIEGNPEKVTDVTDVWTFARDLSSRDPNWKLVATEAGQ